MISELKYEGEKRIFVSYQKDGVKKKITFKEVSKIWDELDEESFEGGKAYVWNEKYIAVFALIASGQGGVLFVWDTDKEEFVHYSDCAYCVDAILVEGDILFLCEIVNYATPAHLEVYSIPFGTKDIFAEGERLYCEAPEEYHSTEPMGVAFVLEDNKLYIADEDSQHLYSSDIDMIKEQKPNEKFANLYKEYGFDDPEKLALKSMIT